MLRDRQVPVVQTYCHSCNNGSLASVLIFKQSIEMPQQVSIDRQSSFLTVRRLQLLILQSQHKTLIELLKRIIDGHNRNFNSLQQLEKLFISVISRRLAQIKG